MTFCVRVDALHDEPHINWRHVDGPLMSWAGRLHWLTRTERLRMWLGLETPRTIAARRFNGFRAELF